MQIEQGKIQLEQRSFSISKCIDDVIEVVSFFSLLSFSQKLRF